jgi:hypothetical protein
LKLNRTDSFCAAAAVDSATIAAIAAAVILKPDNLIAFPLQPKNRRQQ